MSHTLPDQVIAELKVEQYRIQGRLMGPICPNVRRSIASENFQDKTGSGKF